MKTFAQKTLVFFEMIKIEHSIFALPFAYLGLFMAERGWPSVRIFFLVTVAMVSFRTASMGLNRLIDRHIDAKNPRTSDRAIPAGKLKVPFVWGITILFIAMFVWSAYLLSPLCLKLSIIPILLSYLYPWAKRFTWFSHIILGIILGIAPYAAWIASRGTFSWIPGFLTLGVTFWVAGFDILYALQDKDFDKQQGLFSIPAKFGTQKSMLIVRVFHALTIIFWTAAGIAAQLSWIYFVGLGLCLLMLLREHWLVRSFGLEKMNQAFLTMNALIGVTIFLSVVLDLFF